MGRQEIAYETLRWCIRSICSIREQSPDNHSWLQEKSLLLPIGIWCMVSIGIVLRTFQGYSILSQVLGRTLVLFNEVSLHYLGFFHD